MRKMVVYEETPSCKSGQGSGQPFDPFDPKNFQPSRKSENQDILKYQWNCLDVDEACLLLRPQEK